MGGVDFRGVLHHEPQRAERKSHVVLRNSHSRSSSHSENGADYLMGLRKAGSSREYSSIDLRFTTTTNSMALALKQQPIWGRSVMAKDVKIKELTKGLTGGMKIKVENDVHGFNETPQLATIAETEPTASEEYPSSVITPPLEALLISDSDGEKPTQSKDLQYKAIYYPEMDSAPSREISRPMAVATPPEVRSSRGELPRSEERRVGKECPV